MFGILISIFLLSRYILGNSVNETESGPRPIYITVSENTNITRNSPHCEVSENCLAGDEEKKLHSKACHCDSQCRRYKNCCLDSPYYDRNEQSMQNMEYECEHFEGADIFVKRKCPQWWSFEQITIKCSSKTITGKNDLLLSVPVTNIRDNVTYGNVYCAICNGETQFEHWNVSVTCSENDKMDPNELWTNLEFLNDSWTLKTASHLTCNLTVSFPHHLRNHFEMCYPNLVATCPDNFTDDFLRSTCDSYTSYKTSVDDRSLCFRNKECALCNGVADITNCPPISDIIKIYSGATNYVPGRSFSTVLNIRDLNFDDSGISGYCSSVPKEDRINFGPLKSICDPEYPPKNAKKFDEEDCALKYLNESQFVVVNGSRLQINYENPIRYYETSEYEIYENGTAVICDENIKSNNNNYYPVLGTVTTIGLLLSVICLIIHLILFLLLDNLRNLPAKNLASFSFSLLIGYSSFLTGNYLIGIGCFVNAVITYYFLLSAFFWMLIMSWDVTYSLYGATTYLRNARHRGSKTFVAYSVGAWISPAVIVVSALVVEFSPSGWFDDQLRPLFGAGSCWFNHGLSLMVFFFLPFGLLMVLNSISFVSTAYIIKTNKNTARKSKIEENRQNYKLYVKLGILAGSTWSIALFAGYFNSEFLWILFVICNTCQGVSVLLAFSFNKRSIEELRNKYGNENWIYKFAVTLTMTNSTSVNAENHSNQLNSVDPRPKE